MSLTVTALRKVLEEYEKQGHGDLLVIYDLCSEACTLEESDVKLDTRCVLRPDGWVQNFREDKPHQLYLSFPGN